MNIPPNNTTLIAGRSSIYLAKDVAQQLNIPLCDIEISNFKDGETSVELLEPVRGRHCFIILSTHTPVNDNVIELAAIADNLMRSGAKTITAIMPYFGYARQDRRPNFTRVPITSALIFKLLKAAGINRVITVDLHSGQQKGFFDGELIDISAFPEIVADIWKRFPNSSQIKIVSPDVGGVARARAVAKEFNAEIAIVDKRRPKANVSEVMNIVGDVRGFDCILIDDMIDTAGTLCKAARAIIDNGAQSVCAYATHGVFSGKALANIQRSPLTFVTITDTIHTVITPKIKIISVANIIAETIRRIRTKQSVSSMYM